MRPDLRDFWQRLQTGISVAVANPTPDKLLGVRDGFVRYFHDGLDRQIPVAVVPQPGDPQPHGLPVSDERATAHVRAQVQELESDLGDAYHFCVASEGGIHSIEQGDRLLYFIRSWTLVRSKVGEALGGSGSVQLPDRLVASLGNDQIPFIVPGTRRRGGMISSLTGGLENRRRATAVSTVYALSTLFYGFLESRTGRVSV